MKSVKIPLTNGGVTLVDADDATWISKWKWFENNYGYVCRTQHPENSAVFLHRLVNKTPVHLKTDHINGDRRDNRKTNLRHVTLEQSAYNTGKRRGKTSRFKGVYLRIQHRRNDRWVAQICVGGISRMLGSFIREEDAARAYDREAIKAFGEYARLNFPLNSASGPRTVLAAMPT